MDGQTIAIIFQSTRLRKPRRLTYINTCTQPNNFNPRGYVSLDCVRGYKTSLRYDFNPRGYVSLDHNQDDKALHNSVFQSTRLRKPRRNYQIGVNLRQYFNPRGYVSLDSMLLRVFYCLSNFNPRGYVSLDLHSTLNCTYINLHFNPRGYVSLDAYGNRIPAILTYFNPRGYVSLDVTQTMSTLWDSISIHEAT